MPSKMPLLLVLVMCSATLVIGQRPFFAGSRPIGFPDTPNRTTTEGLVDRFGENDATTPKLPIEANGDKDLIDRLSKLPIDKQPFWFINWQALEAHRNKPQTYPQRPSVFVDSSSNTQNTASFSTGQSNSNSDSTFANRFGSTVPNSSAVNSNPGVIIPGDHGDKLHPISTSAPVTANSLGNRIKDATGDILEDSKVTNASQVSSSKNVAGTKKPLYF